MMKKTKPKTKARALASNVRRSKFKARSPKRKARRQKSKARGGKARKRGTPAPARAARRAKLKATPAAQASSSAPAAPRFGEAEPPATPRPTRLAVCSWSLQPSDPHDLLSKLQATGILRVQLALDPLRESPAPWGETGAILRQGGVSIVSGMFGCAGEDYSTLESIRQTGGLAPDSTWDQNRNNIRASLVIAEQLGLKLVTFHAGFLPHDTSDPGYAKMFGRLCEVAGLFAERGLALGLETGQETAEVLAALLQQLNRPNVGVNFDPANMVLYDKGDPVGALRRLGPWLRQVHIKDARRTKTPGTWGEEVAAGDGEVDWPAFFSTLDHLQFAGDLVIEREAGADRISDIRKAKDLVGNVRR